MSQTHPLNKTRRTGRSSNTTLTTTDHAPPQTTARRPGNFPLRWAALLVTAFLLIDPGPACAIRPASWDHKTERDFAQGETHATVITSLGDIKLAAATETIAEAPEEATIIYDLQRVGDDIYLAAGPEGKILRRHEDQLKEVLALDGEQIFALDIMGNDLLVAVSGNGTSRLCVLTNGELKTLVELADARYVWDLLVTDRVIYAATGTDGKILAIDGVNGKDPAISVLLDSKQDNVLCLGMDGHGRLYAGTDGDGLVYRLTINDENKVAPYVLYDAAEPEIGALLVRVDGTAFVGTADAEQAKPGRLTAAGKTPRGRPAPRPPVEEKPDAKETLPTKPATAELAPVAPADSVSDSNASMAQEPSEEAPSGNRDPGSPTTKPDPRSGAPTFDVEHREQQPYGDEQGKPTPQQYDTLRQVMRERLAAARESDSMTLQEAQTDPKAAPTATRRSTTTNSTTGRPTPKKASQKGNAVYRISPEGFVQEIFRESVMVLRLAEQHGGLLIGTGNEGQLYRVDGTGQETAILTDLEPQQLPAMLQDDDLILLGTANPAHLLRLGNAFAAEGVYTSKVLDASQISLWGRLHLNVNTPEHTSVVLESRSGNVEDPEQAPWSEWAKSIVLATDRPPTPQAPREIELQNPPARFLQYRVKLESNGKHTPSVHRVHVAYAVPNLRPKIDSITTTYAGTSKSSSRSSSSAAAKPPPKHVTDLRIEWKASDPNADRLRYELEFQPDGSDRWLTLAEDLTGTRHVWKTEHVPDGRYVIRLNASDAADNTPGMEEISTRDSDPIVVDNTPPVIQNLEHAVSGNNVQVSGAATDEISIVTGIEYIVDGEAPYWAVLPKDLIFDSTREAFGVTISDLDKGPHVIAFRVMDRRNNVRYVQFMVEID